MRCVSREAGSLARCPAGGGARRAARLVLTRGARAQRYPHIMLTSSFKDTRVGFWEPAKLAARLRATALEGSGTLLLVTSFENGHFGTGGRTGQLADFAREAAFMQRAFEMTGQGIGEDKCDFQCKKGGWLGA